MQDHLIKKHNWSAERNSVQLKRKREKDDIKAAIGRMAFGKGQRLEKYRLEALSSGKYNVISASMFFNHLISVNKKTLKYLYIKWIIIEDVSFVQTEKHNFQTFFEYVNPAANHLLPDAANTIKQRIFVLFEEGKQRVQLLLCQAISSIHIICDRWTSPNNFGILATVAHFTNKTEVLQTLLLAIIELEGMHTGVNQGNEILDVLNSYQIQNKLDYFVLDNVNSNDTLVDVVVNNLQAEGISYNAKQHKLCCNGHIINLAVSAFLFDKHPDAICHNQDSDTDTRVSTAELEH